MDEKAKRLPMTKNKVASDWTTDIIHIQAFSGDTYSDLQWSESILATLSKAILLLSGVSLYFCASVSFLARLQGIQGL